MKSEIRVNIMDLIMYVLRKWKAILVVAAIGCVLMGVFGVANENSSTQSTSGLEAYQVVLSEEEQHEVEEAVGFYLINEKNYISLLEYARESLVYKLDATHTPTYRLVYDIEKVSDLELVKAWVKSEETIATMKGSLGLEIDNVYLKELIHLAYEDETESFSVVVVAPEEELCRRIGEYLKSALSTEEFGLSNLSESYSVEVNADIQTKQYEILDQLTLMKSNLDDDYYDFTDAQQDYYDALLIQESDQLNESSLSDSQPLSAIKLAVLGGVVFAVIAIIFFVMKYLLTDTLKTKEDISETYQQHVFAEITDVAIKDNASQMELIQENIKAVGIRNSMKKLVITTTISDAAIEDLENQLKDGLVGEFEQVDVICMKNGNLDAVKAISDCDAVVCIERIQKSTYSEIEKAIDLCHYYKVPLLGYVVVR